MENVVLTIHLILAVLLTGVVLLQRSEGGGLGMGGGGGGVMTGRQAANAMTRLTWIFGIALFCTSIALTVIAAQQSTGSSIMDQLGVPEQSQKAPAGNLPTFEYTPPPSTGGDPLTPPAPDDAAAPATAPAAAQPAAASEGTDAPADAVTPPAAPAEDSAPAN